MPNTEIPEIPDMTLAHYCRYSPLPIPPILQPQGIKFCMHDHPKGNCHSSEECPHYAPCSRCEKLEAGDA